MALSSHFSCSSISVRGLGPSVPGGPGGRGGTGFILFHQLSSNTLPHPPGLTQSLLCLHSCHSGTRAQSPLPSQRGTLAAITSLTSGGQKRKGSCLHGAGRKSTGLSPNLGVIPYQNVPDLLELPCPHPESRNDHVHRLGIQCDNGKWVTSWAASDCPVVGGETVQGACVSLHLKTGFQQHRGSVCIKPFPGGAGGGWTNSKGLALPEPRGSTAI